MKRKICALWLIFSIIAANGAGFTALAAGPGAVVINEVAWAGSNDNSSDEWIELYNTTSQPIDLSGWYIEDDGASAYLINSGVVAPHGFFLIEDNEDAVNVTADAVIGLSLANTGDSLTLNDAAGVEIDAVNKSGGAWPAGHVTGKLSMERTDPKTDNWASAVSGNGAIGSAGSSIIGTPGSINSTYAGIGPRVYIENLGAGTFAVKIEGIDDLYAYGFDVTYDPAKLEFISSQESGFLGKDGQETAFNAALQNSEEGVLVVGGARLNETAGGVDGEGALFTADFKILAAGGQLSFGSSSFVSDINGDVLTVFEDSDSSIAPASGVANLHALPGAQRYSLELDWDAPAAGADSYRVEKMLPDGSFVNFTATADTGFVDDIGIAPGVEYKYRVVPIKNGIENGASEITASETRGLKGDVDRSDRIDGRDIEKLARSYGSHFGEADFDLQADTNYDGIIDGSDLINLGIGFGTTYSENP